MREFRPSIYSGWPRKTRRRMRPKSMLAVVRHHRRKKDLSEAINKISVDTILYGVGAGLMHLPTAQLFRTSKD